MLLNQLRIFMKNLFPFIILCFLLSLKMMAQNGTSSLTKDWLAEEESLQFGCSYVRSLRGTYNAVLYYSMKDKEEVDGIKYSKLFVDVVGLSELKGGLHEMLYIDEEYPERPTCTDVLLIRQKDSKVYCQSEDGTQEWLILDFSLKVGDTFVNAMGERFLVQETTSTGKPERKKLYLLSEDGTQEDTWVEGIGSLQWGFLPDYVVKTLKHFQEVEESLYLNLWAAATPPIAECFVEQSINDEYFKLQPFEEIKDDATEDMTFEDVSEPLLTYSFIGDSLRIKGYYPLNLYHSFVAAAITGTRIDISIHQVTTLNMIRGNHIAKIDVRIPGFHEGTYEIGLLGKDTQTAVCRGTNGICVPQSETEKDAATFDLSGRRLQQKPSKGIYIQGRKKVLIK